MSSVHEHTLHNRIGGVISHIAWYGCRTQARLAADSHVSQAAISRLIREERNPSLTMALLVTQAIERRLGKPIDIWELFSLDGTYPTPSICELVGCHNCLPASFYDKDDNIKPEYRDVRPGTWSLPIQPTGSLIRQEAL